MLQKYERVVNRGRAPHYWFQFFVLGIVVCLFATPLFAQARADSVEQGMGAIRVQMDKGQGLFLAKKYKEAALVFEAGYAQHPYSAFLFNAGVCYQKVGEAEPALSAFRRYLKNDPQAPDAEAVRTRIQEIEKALQDAELAKKENAEEVVAAPLILPGDPHEGMKSLLVIETDPPGALVRVYRRQNSQAPPYQEGSQNTEWSPIAAGTSPLNLTLAVGNYHIVIKKYRDYNRTQTDIEVAAGHVHHFQASLSQGEFTGFLEVTSNVAGAKLYLDDEGEKTFIWGEVPHSGLIPPGKHALLVEAPGYQSKSLVVEVEQGEKKSLEITLKRLAFGVIRLDANVGEIMLSVDQKPVGHWVQGQSALEAKLSAGRHQLLISSQGYKDLHKTVVVPPGQILPMRARMVKKFPRGAAWTQAVLSAGFFGAGIYLGVESNRLDSELSADRAAGYLHEGDSRLNQGLWYSVGANASFTLGGILALVSTYNFLRDPYPDPQLQRGKKREFKTVRDVEPAVKEVGQ